MFKNKSLLKGLGIGLITGALLLQVMNVAAELDQQTNTLEEVQKQADHLGYQLIGKEETVYRQDDLDAAVNTATKEALAQGKKEGLAEAAKKGAAPVEGSWGIIIPHGATSDSVSEMLFKMGMVHDVIKFKRAMQQAGATSKIQTGLYTFPKRPTEAEIIKTITTKHS